MLNKTQKINLEKICDTVLFDIPIASYTTFKVGGKVWALCEVNNINTLMELIRYLYKNDLPYMVLGNGSNVLISDYGFKGVIIRLKGSFKKIKKTIRLNKKVILHVGAGTHISYLLRYCMNSGIGGLEFLAGIPGTIGGATIMNAGAFGKEIGDRVEKINMISPDADIISKDKSKLSFLYRRLNMDAGYIITDVWLKLYSCNKAIVKKKIYDYLYMRTKSQPLDYPSAGCIFKNPVGYHAARLIDMAGLKGKTIGGAMISQKHANFIINTGNAKAQDIMALIRLVIDTIKKEKGIELEPEIDIIGFS